MRPLPATRLLRPILLLRLRDKTGTRYVTCLRSLRAGEGPQDTSARFRPPSEPGPDRDNRPPGGFSAPLFPDGEMPDLKMGTVYGPLNWPVLFCFNRLFSKNNRLNQYFLAAWARFPLEQKTGPSDWQTEPDTGVSGMSFSECGLFRGGPYRIARKAIPSSKCAGRAEIRSPSFSTIQILLITASCSPT